MTALYAGIPATLRHKLPPSLPVWSGACESCQAPIVCHAPSLKRRRQACEKLGGKLQVVCGDCAEQALEQHGGIEVMEFTREVGKHFMKG